MSNTQLMDEVIRMRKQPALPDAEYYRITMLGTEDGRVVTTSETKWVKYTETKPRREIREANTVDSEFQRQRFNQMGQPGVIVNNLKDMFIFQLIGGHGFIEKSLAERFFSDILGPREVVTSYSEGFLIADALPAQKKQHAPTPRLRMSVIKRDGFRCKICGRTPSNNVDIELHVHHVLPWGQGGITEEKNLVTLCGTCHKGLEPHYEQQLFDLLNINWLEDAIRQDSDYLRGMTIYCNGVKHVFLK